MNQTALKRDEQTRQKLSFEPDLWLAIDQARFIRTGSIPRNTWIAEAILEKIATESIDAPLAARG